MPFIVTNRAILNAIIALSEKVSQLMSQQQTDINNAVTVITGLLTDIQTDTGDILTDVTAIQAQLAAGQTVSTTALDGVVGQVTAVQTALDAAVSSLGNVAVPPVTPAPSDKK